MAKNIDGKLNIQEAIKAFAKDDVSKELQEIKDLREEYHRRFNEWYDKLGDQMEQEENKKGIWRKIEEGRKYRIWRKDYNGQTFYNILVEQKQYDNTKKKYYIPVTFKKGVSVDNETDIK